MNIYLTGYRCTGKTSVGKLLATRLEIKFADTDEFIVKKSGMCISEMVKKKGWEFFRKKEKEALVELAGMDSYVIATGGGIILDKDNIVTMKKSGKIIWLRAKIKTIKMRMANDMATAGQRPNLTDKGIFHEVEEILMARNPLYEKAMDFAIDTDKHDEKNICKIIMEKL